MVQQRIRLFLLILQPYSRTWQRGNTYVQNLNAVGGPGVTLTYDNTLNVNGGGSFTQTPGFTINTSTGVMTIPAASTAGLQDNTQNPGGDYFFSGNIKAE